MAKRRFAAAVSVCLLAAACGQIQHELKPQARPFTASGSVYLLESGVGAQGAPCQGLRSMGFADLSSNTPITVRDGPGNALRALLQQGRFAPPPVGIELATGAVMVCVFPFSIKGIAGGQPPYSVTVADRGRVPFSQDEAESLKLVIDRRGVALVADLG